MNDQPSHNTQTYALSVRRFWHRIPGWLRGTSLLFIGILAGLAIAAPQADKVEKADSIIAKERSIYSAASAKRDTALVERNEMMSKLETIRADIRDARADQQADERAARKRLAKLRRKINGAKKTIARNSFEGDGTYIVGEDIEPGIYKAAASPGCYWARLSGHDGLDNIIDNNNVDGPAVITVQAGDFAVEVARCGTFRK